MRIAGNLKKQGKWWAVEIPLLDLDTQGATKNEAYKMAKDVVESMIGRKGFSVLVTPTTSELFVLSGDTKVLMAFAIKRRREAQGLAVTEVARRMGEASPTSIYRYERGEVQPSVEKFFAILKAIDNQEPVLTIINSLPA